MLQNFLFNGGHTIPRYSDLFVFLFVLMELQMFILFYSTGVRICICTANLVPGDWLFKSQGFWVRDFPRKESAATKPSKFETDLLDFLNQVGFLDYSKLKAFDFSTANVR
jgi:hypothetical protein